MISATIKEIIMDNIWNNNKNEVLTNVAIYILIKILIMMIIGDIR